LHLIDFPYDMGGVQARLEKSNEGVRKTWFPLWIPNIRDNLSRVGEFRSVYGLKQKGKTAILVGGGPSLRKNVDKLKDVNRDEVVIVTSAHSLKYLLEHGVKPDYVFVLDAKDVQADWCDIGETDIPLIMEVGCSPKILEKWKGPVYFFRGNSREDFPELYKDTDFSDMVYSGGNVMSCALYWALVVAGYKRIVFVGHDYSNSVNHGVEYADGSIDMGEGDDSFQDYMIACDVEGLGVTTLARMMEYKIWSELLMKKYINVDFVNATEGGIFGVYPQGQLNYFRFAKLSEIDYIW